jgi:hypothetical protein
MLQHDPREGPSSGGYPSDAFYVIFTYCLFEMEHPMHSAAIPTDSQSTQYRGAYLSNRRGWLRHDNRPGDYAKAPRCGARTRSGGCCRQPAMKNGRCRMHGGLSTGPRTAEGLARSRRARWKHGYCSAEICRLRRDAAHTARNLADLVRLARDLCRRRTQSSLGMGFIERNRRSAPSSSGALEGSGPDRAPSGSPAPARGSG